MSDDTLDPDNVPTKPLPEPVDATAPTQPLSASDATEPFAHVPHADPGVPAAAVATVPPTRPGWLAPLAIVLGFALLLVLAVAVLPSLLGGRADPLPTSTPTVTAPTPTLTEESPLPEAPAEEQPPAEEPVPEPEPTQPEPEPTEPPVEPEPTETPAP